MGKKGLALGVILVVLVGVSYYIFNQKNTREISEVALDDFIIKDTASITKIFIASSENDVNTIERTGESLWKLNGKYKARKDGTDLILRTISEIQVKSLVPQSAQKTIIKKISSNHKKIEFYKNNEDTPFKTYWVGSATQDHFGTYMILETREKGISSVPYIVETKTSTGFLTPRFFIKEDEWRYTGIFDYEDLTSLKEIKMEYPEEKKASFKVELGNGQLKLFDVEDKNITDFNQKYLQDFTLQFKKLHYETFERDLSPTQVDSLRKTPVYCNISVLQHDGTEKKLTIHQKKKYDNEHLPGYGPDRLWDANYYYGLIETNEVVLLQRFVFQHVLVPINTFAR